MDHPGLSKGSMVRLDDCSHPRVSDAAIFSIEWVFHGNALAGQGTEGFVLAQGKTNIPTVRCLPFFNNTVDVWNHGLFGQRKG